MQVVSRRRVPYPIRSVVAQYFDLEHVAYVHRGTLGEARLVTCHGNAVLFEQRWPRRFGLGVRLRSTFRLEIVAPNTLRARAVRGSLCGSRLSVVLEESAGATLVTESYEAPLDVPRWLE